MPGNDVAYLAQTLPTSLHDHQSLTQHYRAKVTLVRIGSVGDQLHLAFLVLPRHEDDTVGGFRSLPRRHDA